MRIIKPEQIIEPLVEHIQTAHFQLPDLMLEKLKKAKQQEKTDIGQYVLGEILDNADIAQDELMPLCQDTGVSIFFVEWGQNCILEDMTLQEVIDEAVRRAYKEGYLRKSILNDPLFDRSNTGDNTPAVIHTELVAGDSITLHFLPKGAGADNCSRVAMLTPADGLEGVTDFVLTVCKEAGASSCPPWILGVGVGGTFDTVASLAKHALIRPLDQKHPQKEYAFLEEQLYKSVNALGIGPQGLGGEATALAVHIESRPCHAASLPVAVNIQCHSNRQAHLTI